MWGAGAAARRAPGGPPAGHGVKNARLSQLPPAARRPLFFRVWGPAPRTPLFHSRSDPRGLALFFAPLLSEPLFGRVPARERPRGRVRVPAVPRSACPPERGGPPAARGDGHGCWEPRIFVRRVGSSTGRSAVRRPFVQKET